MQAGSSGAGEGSSKKGKGKGKGKGKSVADGGKVQHCDYIVRTVVYYLTSGQDSPGDTFVS